MTRYRQVAATAAIAALALALNGCYDGTASTLPKTSQACMLAATLFDSAEQTGDGMTQLAALVPDDVRPAVERLAVPPERGDAERYGADLTTAREWAAEACGVQVAVPDGPGAARAILADHVVVIGATPSGSTVARVLGAPSVDAAVALCEQAVDELEGLYDGLEVVVEDDLGIPLATRTAGGTCA